MYCQVNIRKLIVDDCCYSGTFGNEQLFSFFLARSSTTQISRKSLLEHYTVGVATREGRRSHSQKMDVRIVGDERRMNMISASSVFINDQASNNNVINLLNNNHNQNNNSGVNHPHHQQYQNNHHQIVVAGMTNNSSTINGNSSGALKAGVVLRTRVELPQFDFQGLPQIPVSSGYAKRLSEIKQYGPNTFVLNKSEKPPSSGTQRAMVYQYTTESIANRKLMQEREQVTLPNIRSRESKSAQSLGKPVQILNRQTVVSMSQHMLVNNIRILNLVIIICLSNMKCFKDEINSCRNGRGSFGMPGIR